MATSGTISQTVFDTRKVLDHAFSRCKLPPQTITSERIALALDALYLLLSDLPNKGVQMWTVDRQILPLYEGMAALSTPAGTIDVLSANLRSLTRLTGTDSSTSTTRQTDFGTGVAAGVATVGLLWSGAAVPFVIERSPDAVTWIAAATQSLASATAGEWTWVDIDRLVGARYWRARATTGTFALTEVYWGAAPSEIPVAALSRDSYDSLPNKTFAGRPLQYWLDLQYDVPVMRLWPVPNAASAYQQIVIRRKRYVMDVGTMQMTLEIPQRWFLTVVALLADALGAIMPDQIDPAVQAANATIAQQAMTAAIAAGQGGGPLMIGVGIAAYTK